MKITSFYLYFFLPQILEFKIFLLFRMIRMTEIPSLWTVGLRRNSAIGDYTNRSPHSETHDGQIQRTAVERWLSFVFSLTNAIVRHALLLPFRGTVKE